jgi:hypothetical protein
LTGFRGKLMHIAHDKFRPSESKDSRMSSPNASIARFSDPGVVVIA